MGFRTSGIRTSGMSLAWQGERECCRMQIKSMMEKIFAPEKFWAMYLNGGNGIAGS